MVQQSRTFRRAEGSFEVPENGDESTVESTGSSIVDDDDDDDDDAALSTTTTATKLSGRGPERLGRAYTSVSTGTKKRV